MARTDVLAPAIPPEILDDAAATARLAAERAGVVVRTLDTRAELDAASNLVEQIWQDGEPKAPVSLLRALVHAGSFVAGAYDDRELVGISFGFLSLDESELHLHSHITGIAPESRSRSLGFALKQFQRSWVLSRGMCTVQWTTDPLVRGNLFFNLVKLGAAIVSYHDDFYGPLRDRLNAGEQSDRVVVRWDLVSERVIRSMNGNATVPAPVEGTVILSEGAEGEPVTGGGNGDRTTMRAWIPNDIVGMRELRPELAHAWRHAVRDTIGRELDSGYRAEQITRDGWLVLTR